MDLHTASHLASVPRPLNWCPSYWQTAVARRGAISKCVCAVGATQTAGTRRRNVGIEATHQQKKGREGAPGGPRFRNDRDIRATLCTALQRRESCEGRDATRSPIDLPSFASARCTLYTRYLYIQQPRRPLIHSRSAQILT